MSSAVRQTALATQCNLGLSSLGPFLLLFRQPVNVTGLEVELFEHSLLLPCHLDIQKFGCPPLGDGGEDQCQRLAWLS